MRTLRKDQGFKCFSILEEESIVPREADHARSADLILSITLLNIKASYTNKKKTVLINIELIYILYAFTWRPIY